MTKTKKQLRAKAVERLKMLDEYGGGSFEYAILGSDKIAWRYMDKRDALIDLLTDDDANDDSTPEKVVSVSEPCVTPESCRQYSDQQKRAIDADRESCDSREKLEADMREYFSHWIGGTSRTQAAIIGWLDRQAAITQHEITERWAEHLHPIERKCGDLRRKVEELTAERDEYREKLSKALDLAHEIGRLQP